MITTWCPVRLVTPCPEFQTIVSQQCDALGVQDFQYRISIDQPRRRDVPLAQIVLIDIQDNQALEDIEQTLAPHLKSTPRDIVLCVGRGLPGSFISQLMRLGMNGFIDKPVSPTALKKALHLANDHCIELRKSQHEFRLLDMKRRSITKSEEQVLEMVVQGIPNKCIATRLDVSQRTIETRRQKIYRKMNANRLADLIRTLDKLDNLSSYLT